MTTCVIMQPTFLPWAGYFNLAWQSDVFVFLDDVQFARRSWQTRNRILHQGKELFINVPVRKAAQSAPIAAIDIAYETPWQEKLDKTLRQSYPLLFDGDALPGECHELLFRQRHEHLSELNMALIEALAKWLDIDCRFMRASELQCGGKRSAHLAEICHAVGATEYLSPQGSRTYLEEDRFSDTSGLALRYQSFQPSPYPQSASADFISHLSMIDVLGQQGADFARSYIQQE